MRVLGRRGTSLEVIMGFRSQSAVAFVQFARSGSSLVCQVLINHAAHGFAAIYLEFLTHSAVKSRFRLELLWLG